MTSLQARPTATPHVHTPEHPVDLSAVATEPPAESIAHENEIVEHIAHEHDYPEQPCEHPIDEHLQGLLPPEEIRAHR